MALQYNLSKVYEISENDVEFALQIVNLFLQEVPDEIKSIKVSEEAKKEKTDILLDLIIAAYNNAKENLKRKSNEELSKITGGINFPSDLNFPLK